MHLRYYESHPLKKYPHMGALDTLVWHRFIKHNFRRYGKIAYDVRVGHGRKCADHQPDNMKRDWHALTCKRIDVLAFASNRIDLIEVKPRAGYLAWSQLLVYKKLLAQTYDFELPVQCVAVCESIDDDVKSLMEKDGMIWHIV